ncbi:MAG: hypothetical protein JXR84_08205 [Anaerolineae bacterium]|nr:hypothetical protein [Anaerolineae bacterium]
MFKRFLPTIMAMLAGILILLGYLLPLDFLVTLRDVILLRWAMILAAFALIVAYLNLVFVHLLRLTSARKKKFTSLLVVLSAIGTLILVLVQGAEGAWTQQVLSAVLIPGESALLALTAVTLIVAGMRILRARRTAGAVIFVIAAGIILLTTVAYSVYPRVFVVLREGVNTLATAGMRGLVMGVALGVTLTALRILLGIDRPHSDE